MRRSRIFAFCSLELTVKPRRIALLETSETTPLEFRTTTQTQLVLCVALVVGLHLDLLRLLKAHLHFHMGFQLHLRKSTQISRGFQLFAITMKLAY